MDGGGCAPGFAGCTVFTDGTAPSASRVITFQDFSYAPQCLQVKAGQTVTFQGNFVRHPLTPSCGPASVLKQSSGSTATFVLSAPGLYGYFCLDHGSSTGQAMSGAILVLP